MYHWGQKLGEKQADKDARPLLDGTVEKRPLARALVLGRLTESPNERVQQALESCQGTSIRSEREDEKKTKKKARRKKNG